MWFVMRDDLPYLAFGEVYMVKKSNSLFVTGISVDGNIRREYGDCDYSILP